MDLTARCDADCRVHGSGFEFLESGHGGLRFSLGIWRLGEMIYSLGLLRIALLRVALLRVAALVLRRALLIVFLAGHCAGFGINRAAMKMEKKKKKSEGKKGWRMEESEGKLEKGRKKGKVRNDQ